MKITLVVLLFISILSQVKANPYISMNEVARLGSGNGNGGDVVVCRDQHGNIIKEKMELLDFYEAETLRDIKFTIGSDNLAMNEFIIEFLNQLEKIDSYRANRYRKSFDDFFSQTKFIKGSVFVDIPDSDHIFFPKGCSVEQIAIQQEVYFPEDKKYLINKDLWKALSDRDRFGLMLHEIIYSDALSLGHEDSRNTRYLTSMLCSNFLGQTPSISEWYNLLKTVGFSNSKEAGAITYMNIPLTNIIWSQFSPPTIKYGKAIDEVKIDISK